MRKIYFSILFLFSVCTSLMAQVSLTVGAYTQDFSTLANTGTSSTLPTGWLMAESGTNANTTYTAGTGSSNSGDTYSFGPAASTERAFGGLQSGSLIPTIGSGFVNNTGGTITSLAVAYTGEQWRLGTSGRAIADKIDFQYSTDATSLITGTWADINSLDFTQPLITGTVGALDGNAAANRTAISFTITGLTIANGATFFIRWNSFDATGADDGLSIDDFSITPTSTGGGGTNLSINDVSVTEGNAGTVNAVFTVSLSSPAGAGGVTFDIATANNTATTADNDYVLKSLTGQTIAAGNSTYTFTVVVNGDVNIEPNETFFVNVTNVTGATVGDGQGQGTITNDDAGCGTTHTIAQVQGSGNTSPITGAAVTIKGIVTGRRSNGFFLQTPDASVDADPNTSEGVFVFTAAAPPVAAAVGNEVCVAGSVTEFFPSTDPNSPTQTEIISPVVTQLSTGNALPAAIALTTLNTNPAGSLYQLERFESMRVAFASLTVVAPTQGNVSEANATSTSNGFFYGVITGINRPFREPGIAQPDPLPGGAPLTVTRFDANPELIGVGSSSIGGTAIDVATGAILTNVIGPLDFRSRTYTIDTDPALPPVVSNNGLTFTAVPAQTTDELTVASFNVERFFDDINDPNGDAVLTATAYANRLNKVSLAIRNVLNTPDIIGMVEVEKLAVLQAVANKVNADAVAASQPNPSYVAYLVEGNDVGGIDVGFLVKSGRVNVTSVTQYGLSDTYIDPNTSLPALLNDRPPLVLNGTFTGSTCNTGNITVIVNHLRSLNSIGDPIDGNRVRTKRARQAEFLATLIQGFQIADPTVNIVSVGDINAFEFNDGYVDLIGTIKGSPTPATDVVLASPDLVNPNLTNLADAHPAAQRYSYSFAGNAQILDHILVNSNLVSKISRFHYARLDADFPEVYRTDANRPERISDHDAAVAYILFADVTPPVITTGTIASCYPTVAAAEAAALAATTATDNCPGVPTEVASTVGTCSAVITVTVTDANSNSATTTYNTRIDNTAPTVTVGTIASCYSTVAAAEAAVLAATSATDNCPGALTEIASTVGTCSAVITVTTTDGCGNVTAVTYNTRIDGIAPTVTVGTIGSCYPTVAAAEAAALAATSATDNCPGALTEIASTVGTCSAVITVTTTDGCGNATAVTYNTRIDNTAPVITCPAAVTVSCAANVPAVNTASVTATDNCPGVIAITHVSDVISNQICLNRFTVTRTYRATDVCGNFTQCTQIITVNDQTAPVITCSPNLTATTPIGSCTAVVNFTTIAIDNCAGAVTIVSSPASGTAFAIGTTTVTSTATDVCGNSSTCTFTVTVLDAQLPTITAQPVNRTVCAGSSATFNVTAVTTPNAGGPIAYQWQQWNGSAWVNVTTGTGATTAALTFANVSNLPQNTNTFRVVLTGLCTVVNSGAASLYINPLPTISLTASIPPILLPGQTLSITATVNPAGGSFVWFKNGVAIPGVTGGTLSGLTVDNLGTYRAVYTDPNGCVSTSADITVSGQPSNNLFVYPNPNTGVFQVRFYNIVNEAATVIISDSKGARVFVQKFTTQTPYSKLDINISRVPAGTYLVEVVNGAGKRLAAKRIIKQN